MPQVKGLKEKVHFPLYDAITVKPPALQASADPNDPRVKIVAGEETRSSIALSLSSGIWRYFVDVQRKSKVETNMQAAGVLPHFNTLEIFSLRVAVTGGYRREKHPPVGTNTERKVSESDFFANAQTEFMNFVLFNSVTTLFVGEKIMIQHPTFYFPAGGGVAGYVGSGGQTDDFEPNTQLQQAVANNGVPSTAATFRFAEPVLVEKQQNFRVEIEFPDRDLVQQELSQMFGPARVWVTLDGFLTRTVQ